MTSITKTNSSSKHLLVSIFLGLGFCLCQCGPPRTPTERKPSLKAKAADKSPVAAKVNGETLTKNDIRDRLESLHPYPRHNIIVSNRQGSFLKSVVDFEVLADVAEKKKIDQKIGTYVKTKQNIVDEWLASQGDDRISIPDYLMDDIPRYQKRVRKALDKATQKMKRTHQIEALKKQADIDINQSVLSEFSKE